MKLQILTLREGIKLIDIPENCNPETLEQDLKNKYQAFIQLKIID